MRVQNQTHSFIFQNQNHKHSQRESQREEMPKRGKKRRERRKRSEERDNILRLTGCTEVRNKSKAGDLRQYSEDLMRLFGRYSFSIFLTSYLFHRFGDHLDWKDPAAANLLRLRERKGIEELKTALKHMFPHVNDKLIWKR